MTPRVWLSLAILGTFAGCRDAAAPPLAMVGQMESDVPPPTDLHVLQQSPTAPRLESYRVSFWAYHDKATTVRVKYQPAAGQEQGDRFLRFDIPKFGLMAGADGVPLAWGDSVLITLTVDTVNLSVDFQPSGVVFSRVFPARLAISYAHANPDLNADGVVDATDQMLEEQVAIWCQTVKTQGWFKLYSKSDTTQLYVASALYHFSEYAVSW